jgi:integrase
VPRLYLRVADGGRRRSWVWRAVRGGKVTSMGLGRAGQGGVSLADARARAKALNKDIDDGVNPLERRRERQRAEAARLTLRQATEAFIKEKNPKWGASSRAIWRRLADRDIEVIADLPVDTVGRGDIARAVHSLHGRVGMGNRARLPGVPAARLLQQRVSTVLRYASENGWRPENAPFQWSMIAEESNDAPDRRHPALKPPVRDHVHTDWKDYDVIVEAIRRLRTSDSVSARCLEFIALTAVRVSEATNAKWDEFNLKTATWTIPAARMKMRWKKTKPPDHVIPLSDRALQIVNEAALTAASDYVFIGQRDGKPISRNSIHDQCDRVTGGKASPHGWRATFRTWAASKGISYEVAEAALAHTGGPLAESYQRNS